MKKSVFAALCAVAALSAVSAAHAASPLTGTIEATASTASLSSPWPDSKVNSVSALFNLADEDKIGVSVTDVDAWGDKATYLNVRNVYHFSPNSWLDSNVGFSDRGNITAEKRVNTMYHQKFPGIATILGVGADYYSMRSGGSASAVRASAVKYVTGMPLVLQADLTLSVSNMNDRSGHRLAVAATYGRVGNWTISANASTGRVHYELISHPGSVADYTNDSVGVGARYWVNKDWGVSLNLAHQTNRYYKRDEVRAGVFINF